MKIHSGTMNVNLHVSSGTRCLTARLDLNLRSFVCSLATQVLTRMRRLIGVFTVLICGSTCTITLGN